MSFTKQHKICTLENPRTEDNLTVLLTAFASAAIEHFAENRLGRAEDHSAFIQAVSLLMSGTLMQRSKPTATRRPLSLSLLPRPVLRRLLEHCDMKQRIALSQSCSVLRREASSFKHLWSEYRGTGLSLSRHSYLFARSAPSPVHLHVTVISEQLESSSKIIGFLLPRLESLVVEIPVPRFNVNPARLPELLAIVASHTTSLWNSLRCCLSFPAPLLQSLRIDIPSFRWVQAQCYILPDVLAGDPGRLRSCCLSGVSLPEYDPCTAFSGLTTFEYSTMSSFNTAQLDVILGCMENLDRFTLDVPSFVRIDPAHKAPRPIKKVSITMTLGSIVDISALDYFGDIELFANIVLRRNNLEVPHASQGIVTGTKFVGPVHTAVIEGSQLSTIIHNSGRYMLRIPTAVLWPQHLFWFQVTLLSIHEFQLRLHPSPLTLPQLQELCITLATCNDHLQYLSHHLDTCDSGLHAAETQIVCPNIRTLYVSFPPTWPCAMASFGLNCWCESAAGCAIALSDIARFVQDSLRFSSPKLEQLVLVGVESVADYDLPTALCTLSEVVGQLDFREMLPAHIERLNNVALRHSPLTEDDDRNEAELHWATLFEEDEDMYAWE